MLVYFCTVKTQGPVSLKEKKEAQYVRKTKTKLTVNSNYFYYHIVILLLYSEILLFSTKNVCLPVCFIFILVFWFFPSN